MKEIEILIEVKNDLVTALKALESFESHGMKETLDIYFKDRLREDLQPDPQGRLTNALRLRQKGDKSYITHKQDHFDDMLNWTHSDELETEIPSFGTVHNIFMHLGLEELVRVETKKYIFTTQDYEIVLEEVTDLGLFLEVEKMTQVSDDEVARTKEEIRSFINTLDIEFGEEQNAGKPELLLRKKLIV